MPTEFCRHIRATGHRCGSPAMTGHPLCYFHRRAAEQYRLEPLTEASLRVTLNEQPSLAQHVDLVPDVPINLNFPPLEDRAAVQIAISMLLGAMGQNRIETKRALALLYGLQVASANAKTLVPNTLTVRDVIVDEQGQELALDEDPEDDPYDARAKQFKGKGSVERMWEELERRGEEEQIQQGE